MKFTVDWLKNHLDTKFNNNQIIDKLTNIGLEVESLRVLHLRQILLLLQKL